MTPTSSRGPLGVYVVAIFQLSAQLMQVPGGQIDDSHVVKGVVLNKDVTHAKMARRKEKPRVVLLDCNLEYKKGESQMSLEIMKEEDFSKVLEQVS